MPVIEIRALSAGDLPAFEQHFDEGNPSQLTHALRLQAKDSGVMLVAWLADMPVGRVIVHWRPIPETPPEWETGVAFPEEFIVLEHHRSSGIGTAILAEAERIARRGAIG